MSTNLPVVRGHENVPICGREEVLTLLTVFATQALAGDRGVIEPARVRPDEGRAR